MGLVVVSFGILFIAIIAGLIVLRKRVVSEQNKNIVIYEKELELLKTRENEPEGKETVLTFRDLEDIDDSMYYGRPNY